MPRLSVIERDWEKAVEIVKESYPDVEVGSPQFWALVFGVVKRMRGRKSARHLRSEGVLEKQLGNIEYLPYIFHQKVQGVDLWMDLPPHPAHTPPSAIPSVPAARSYYVDLIRRGCAKRGWNENKLADEVVNLIIKKPILVSFNKKQLEDLVQRGKVFIESVSNVSEEEEVAWKLVWVYAMLAGKIQPLSPRWGYRLAQLTREIKDTALRRIQEHFDEVKLNDVLGFFKDDFVVSDFRSGAGCGVLSLSCYTDKILAAIKYEWEEEVAGDLWEKTKVALMSTMPVWVAYALHVIDEIDLDEDVKYLFPTSLDASDFLFVVTDDSEVLNYHDPKVDVLPLTSSKDEFTTLVKRKVTKEDFASLQGLRDEIISTVRKRWI